MTDLTTQLADFARRAPEAVAPTVLMATGLADGFIERQTPAGRLQVAFNDRGVSAAALTPDRAAFAHDFGMRFGRPVFAVEAIPASLARHLDRCLETGRVGALPLDLRAVTDFQRAVLEVVSRIPPGQVRPYGWVARESGHPGASRAVGTTMARNPIPVVVPCHRVVRSDGHLGNYLYGVPAKTALLEAEGVDVEAIESNAAAGRVLLGSDTTNVVCLPTCSHAQRITPAHRVWFKTMGEAGTAGFRACRYCRPSADSPAA